MRDDSAGRAGERYPGVESGIAVGGAFLALAALLWPHEFLALSPPCLWTHLFGFDHCPGCGMTRALVSAMHGQWQQAIHFNRSVVVVAPLLVVEYLKTVHHAYHQTRRFWSSEAKMLRFVQRF